ncbi:MAG: hypothetical protein COZ06_10220 [Armatimonadetes bacterium CG_4_10_14_3_um_filter_66_18]|nr:MAG: hypothetical protein COS65_21325 [Armatimonadetes bacterium CG06_land_8_20_14_3_00_66_21]PIX39904.1 MAG: hypothetical protein COZ57_27175 [Armatimonadetes bacterium CG_4_8_14_3_um_filter_66_20]PIY50271.1 MAG: hypothetical protein COZ06_10220 [Armatimonadetes bacterium CG_4_10_14_3_um_filter_66_18]PJB71328.1 MAG: hypothetical protein CO096_09910 [Armatimonadetes bacterium CG_4_9_14_3_um_filter_66_14]
MHNVPAEQQRPSFLWDYNLSVADVQHTLASGSEAERRWLTERILLHAPWDEIWEYLTPQSIRAVLPALKLPAPIKGTWKRALELWAGAPEAG